MSSFLHHPALILAALSVVCGTLGTYMPCPGIGDALRLGLHMVLSGVWFGLVVGFSVWHWANRSWVAAAAAIVATWAGWQLAVNLAMQLNERWLEAASMPEPLWMYVSGFATGWVGAFITLAGVAVFAPRLWQIGIAAILGLGLAPVIARGHPDISDAAVEFRLGRRKRNLA